MMEITIGTSQLTGKIYAGSISKSGIWKPNKQDVTMQCLLATIEHCLKFGETVQIMKPDGVVEFEIDVKDLRKID